MPNQAEIEKEKGGSSLLLGGPITFYSSKQVNKYNFKEIFISDSILMRKLKIQVILFPTFKTHRRTILVDSKKKYIYYLPQN